MIFFTCFWVVFASFQTLKQGYIVYAPTQPQSMSKQNNQTNHLKGRSPTSQIVVFFYWNDKSTLQNSKVFLGHLPWTLRAWPKMPKAPKLPPPEKIELLLQGEISSEDGWHLRVHWSSVEFSGVQQAQMPCFCFSFGVG